MATAPKAEPHQDSDSILALAREGYAFLPKRWERYRASVFEIRIAGLRILCLRGEAAARLFYDPERFQRDGAIPKLLQRSFLGNHPVHTLDGDAHRHCKGMLVSLMTTNSLDRLTDLIEEQWRTFVERWSGMERVELFSETQELLCRAACAWAGVPLRAAEVGRRARDFWLMVDAFGALTPLRHLHGILARRRAEQWLSDIVRQARKGPAGGQRVGGCTALGVIAAHRGREGRLLEEKDATVALINVLRPLVAVSVYITFVALALREHPECLFRLREDGDMAEGGYLSRFVDEARRFYPFAPFVAARVRDPFYWQGKRFRRRQLVLLDIYGTNHDARLWDAPEEFLPDRFLSHPPGDFDLIPQGGGDYLLGHRCQDLRFSLSRMPTVPRSGFLIARVRGKEGAPTAER